MSIGSLTAWNFGERVRSRDYHYILHCLSLEEKNVVLKDLWQQHTEEMLMLEGNIFTVCGQECTMEFQPSADMCWQSWANNELNQAATFPSPYANVSLSDLSTINGSIGEEDNNTWKPYTKSVREKHAEKVAAFQKSLPANLTEEAKHKNLLKFMAENGIRQLGQPLIGDYAERQRPEPMQCEINTWQKVLHLIYLQYVERGILKLNILKCNESIIDNHAIIMTFLVCLSICLPACLPAYLPACLPGCLSVCFFHLLIIHLFVSSFVVYLLLGMFPKFMEVLSASKVNSSGNCPILCCGLGYLVPKIKEHYDSESTRFNKLPTRLIGEQAIALANYSYRLVDSLVNENESQPQRLNRLALGLSLIHI